MLLLDTDGPVRRTNPRPDWRDSGLRHRTGQVPWLGHSGQGHKHLSGVYEFSARQTEFRLDAKQNLPKS